MKISLVKYVQEGYMLPRFYGVAYVEYWNHVAVAYPVPINLIVRFGRWVWQELVKYRPTKFDEELRKAYNTGWADGNAQRRKF